MPWRQFKLWTGSAALATAFLGWATAVLALPHQVVPVPATTDALSLVLYVKSSVGEAHFVVVPSSAKAVPATVTADDLVDPSQHEVFKEKAAKNGSFAVRASERSAHAINGLACGQAYDVFFVTEAANSNGLFSPVGRVLGVSTNGAAPSISSITAAPVSGRTNATELSLSMDALNVPCRVWYTVQPLRDTVFLTVEELTPEEIRDVARPDSFIVNLPQGLKGMRTPHPVNDGLESDTWYQISAVSERAEGVFGEPVFTVAKTHREPARVIEIAGNPVQGSTDSIDLRLRLDCSSTPTSDACGLLSYRVTETLPRGSLSHLKPRQVAQGTAVIVDGRAASHVIPGLSPGKAYAVTMEVESPDSNGVFGPTFEVSTTTFSRAPSLALFEAVRSDAETTTVTVRYKLSEPGLIHVNFVERVGHPLAMLATTIGNQHGVSFSQEVGMARNGGDADDDSEGSDTPAVLEGSQTLHGLSAGSSFDVTATTESTPLGRQSSVHGQPLSRVVEAAPPLLSQVRLRPPDATTTELLLEYEVLETAGRMYYALSEAVAAITEGGKDNLKHSPEKVKSAIEGQKGVVAAGSVSVSPTGDGSSRGDSESGSSSGSSGMHIDAPPPTQRLWFRGLTPQTRYAVTLCTEGNSGTLSKVVAAEADSHAEAPLVAKVTATPADRSAEALSLTVSLESAGLVHLVVRRAAQDTMVVTRDHTIVHKATREVNGTSSSSSQKLPAGVGAGVGATKGGGHADIAVTETVQDLEPNATYEAFIATETLGSNGVYREHPDPILATTHPVPPSLLDAHARAADASSSALVVTVSLETLAEVHYAVFPTGPKGGLTDQTETERHSQERFAERQSQGSLEAEDVSARSVERDDDGEGNENEAYVLGGCGNATATAGGAVALNETRGLVASGVMSSATSAASLLARVDRKPAPEANIAAVAMNSAVAATSHASEAQQQAFANKVPGGEEAMEVVFRVEGLKAAEAYDVCLFTETPGSNGLFGDVHELQAVSTHGAVPELASKQVACTLNCGELNRDPCWLEENKCGECVEGFVGKAGHVNSPCGKVLALTDEDIARIAERERQEAADNRHADPHPHTPPKDADGESRVTGRGPKQSNDNTPTNHVFSRSHTQKGASDVSAIDRDTGALAAGSQLLLGVPVAIGPNVTKFVYAQVPVREIVDEDEVRRQAGSGGRNGTASYEEFDAEEAAAFLCADLRKSEEEPPSCLASLSVALASRFRDGHFRPADDPQRPVLQVEVDTPEGEYLAFTLRHGEEAGSAAVGFCRDNHEVLPDEQACVIRLIQEMSS